MNSVVHVCVWVPKYIACPCKTMKTASCRAGGLRGTFLRYLVWSPLRELVSFVQSEAASYLNVRFWYQKASPTYGVRLEPVCGHFVGVILGRAQCWPEWRPLAPKTRSPTRFSRRFSRGAGEPCATIHWAGRFMHGGRQFQAKVNHLVALTLLRANFLCKAAKLAGVHWAGGIMQGGDNTNGM